MRRFWPFLLICLSGCHQAPPTRNLDRLPPISSVRVGTHIDSGTIQSLFRDLSKHPGLEKLRPLADEADAEILNLAAKIADELSSPKNPTLHEMDALIVSKTFSRLRDELKTWENSEAGGKALDFLAHGISHPSTPPAVLLAKDFLSSEWRALLPHSAARYEVEPELLREIARLAKMTSPDVVLTKSQAAYEDGFFLALLRASRKWNTEAKAGALAKSNADLLTLDPSPLASLFRFADVAQGPSNGVYEVASKKLWSDPEAFSLFQLMLRPWMVRHVAERWISEWRKESPLKQYPALMADLASRGHGAGFDKAFKAIYGWTVSVLERSLDSITDPQDLLGTYAVRIHSYVLCRWMEAAAISNPVLLREGALPTVAMKFPALSVDLIRDAVQVRNDFSSLGLLPFWQDAEPLVQRGKLGGTRFDVEAAEVTFESALQNVLLAAHDSRPLANPTAWLKASLSNVTRPGPSGSLLSSLETPRWFESLLFPLSRLDTGLFAQQLMTEEWLSNHYSAFIDLVYSEEKDRKLHRKMEVLGQALSALVQIGMASPENLVVLYQDLLQETPMNRWRTLAELPGFLGKAGVLERNSGAFRFPALVKALEAPSFWEGTLGILGKVPTSQEGRFLAPMGNILGSQLDARPLVDLGFWALEKDADAVTFLLNKFFVPIAPDFPEGALSAAHAMVSIRPVASLWELLQKRLTAEKTGELLESFRVALGKGMVRDFSRLLSQVNDERLQEIGKVSLRWEESGELNAVLDILSLLHKHFRVGS